MTSGGRSVVEHRGRRRATLARRRDVAAVLSLGATGAVAFALERRFGPLVPRFTFRGAMGRDVRWLGQYGQTACTLAAAAVVAQLDEDRGRRASTTVLSAGLAAALVAGGTKRLAGRTRPGWDSPATGAAVPGDRSPVPDESARDEASGALTFPSSHTAAAVAFTVVLSHLYPQGRAVFRTLAVACAAQRSLTHAHWLSDVLAGAAVGYAAGHLVWRASGRGGPRRGAPRPDATIPSRASRSGRRTKQDNARPRTGPAVKPAATAAASTPKRASRVAVLVRPR